MLFNSLTFFIFLLVVLTLYQAPIGWRGRKTLLLVASYVFYASWNPPFAALLGFSTMVDWFAARGIASTARPSMQRLLLMTSLSVNFGFLGFFKYGAFLLDNFRVMLAACGVIYQPPELDIFLPVGISFYTFQTISYTVDVYRREIEPSHSLLDFALYVSFFPQLVAGPIVRAGHFLPQCKKFVPPTVHQYGWGFTLLTMGLFQKVVLADTLLAPVADEVYGQADLAGFADAWIGTLAFSGQIFFDFSGYSTCAIGIAMLLGFALPDNFRSPYGAIGFSDFWKRWHVSLSSWLRDYLYIPLGGNRGGAWRTRANLMAVMLLGGLWHGASWRFVVWGALHGLYLIVERELRRRWGSAAWITSWPGQAMLMATTYGLVCITWVFFRATDFESAFTLAGAMLLGTGTNQLILGYWAALTVMAINFWLVMSHASMRHRNLEEVWGRFPSWLRVVVLTGFIIAIIYAPGEDRAFIYFQF